MPTTVPSRFAPISTRCTCARPWLRFSMLSDRVSAQRTGRPSAFAAAATIANSG